MAYVGWLIVIVVFSLFAMLVGYFWYQKYKVRYKLNAATVFGVLYGLAGAALVVHAIIFWPTEKERIYGELTALAGAALGWLAGMWLSPIGASESSKFTKYWTAVGVGSGFTLKWLGDKLGGEGPYRSWIVEHPFLCLIFVFSLVLTTAAVYSTRAYNDTLLIAARKPLAAGTLVKDDFVEIKMGTTAQFYAAVVGPNDPLSWWQVLPGKDLGEVSPCGLFKPARPGEGRITAFNVEDPTLSNAINIRVVASAPPADGTASSASESK